MDSGDQYDDDFYEYPDEDGMNMPVMGPHMGPSMNFGNNRYRFAYGAYRGGYGSVGGRGGFGPPRHFGPLPNFGPPPNFCPGPANFPDFQGPRLWFRGPPFLSRPQKTETIKYLIKCGVPRENLRQLPRDLLRLIDPEYCGLCAIELDSFNLSRVHYNSKNHLKNQKKWLNNRMEFANTMRGKMNPMKSRDLYCELCDVQITSKVHSESHYNGKSHRAIVEGRKNPKNPILLQPGMEDRVIQLIRREKRCLVPLDEVETEEKPQEKPVAAELYCDICKTFVTCSEQMTLHMNGKKHLNKEKQHILRMMKGDIDPNDDTSNKDQQGVEDGAADDYEEGGNGKDAADDDWENSGENWDEPKTQA